MLHNILQDTGKPTVANSDPVQYVNSADVENPWSDRKNLISRICYKSFEIFKNYRNLKFTRLQGSSLRKKTIITWKSNPSADNFSQLFFF